LTYKAKLDNREYKFHEFHIAFNSKTILRFIWIADVQNTIVNTKLDWEKIDEQNHYIEFFHLTDSAKFHLKEVVPNDFHKLAYETFKESGYMGAVQELKSYENTVETKGTEAQKNQFYQTMMVYQSFLGDHKAALNYNDKVIKPKAENVDANYFDGYESHNAAQYIVKKVENERVVIFNEAHYSGQQRAFMRDILRRLYEKGFKHLALETLDAKDKTINQRGYPLRIKSGFYSDEPTFGQMLREAKAVGFQVWDYEDTLDCKPPTNYFDFREQQQAENLKTIMDKLPNEKLLIWVGHGHIYESTPQMDFKMMASYFKKKTGINPYTIEQTTFSETANETTDPAIWKVAMKKWQFKKPIVVTKKDSVFVFPPMQGIVDMQVFFPKTEYPNHYPNWMGNSDTHFYEINIEKALYRDRLLKIFIKKEYDREIESAIPVMNIPLSKIGIFKLYLKPDKYVAVVRDGGNWEYLYKEFEIQPDFQTEIDQLSTDELRKAYLLAIFNDDQKVRKDLEDVAKFGQESKEFQERGQAMMRMDSINSVKIEKYLAQYPYPSKSIYGEIPVYTPWTVIHHSSSLDMKQRYFPQLYKVWKNKDIKDNSFYLYLNRAYRFKFQKAFKRESGVSNLDEINQLIKELGFIIKE
jgi:hypothetical protein